MQSAPPSTHPPRSSPSTTHGGWESTSPTNTSCLPLGPAAAAAHCCCMPSPTPMAGELSPWLLTQPAHLQGWGWAGAASAAIRAEPHPLLGCENKLFLVQKKKKFYWLMVKFPPNILPLWKPRRCSVINGGCGTCVVHSGFFLPQEFPLPLSSPRDRFSVMEFPIPL